ncbi:MAG: hypothetical protein LQ337_000956 [Flavoplaca oasis]|nr:MAG: hypothetical protein LQ337_000956 [Flavoplaca oasis]
MHTSTLAFALLPLLAAAYRGDMTYYTPGPASSPGSCGDGWTPGMDVVALSHIYMHSSEYPNGNLNPRCRTRIAIRNVETGEAHEALVIDTCMGCAEESIDVNEELFNKVAPNGDGRVRGVEWYVVGSRGGTDETTGDSTDGDFSTGSSGGGTPTTTTGDGSVVLGSRACETPGETVCSEDGMMFGTCAMDHTAVMMSVGAGTACRGGRIELAKRSPRMFFA